MVHQYKISDIIGLISGPDFSVYIDTHEGDSCFTLLNMLLDTCPEISHLYQERDADMDAEEFCAQVLGFDCYDDDLTHSLYLVAEKFDINTETFFDDCIIEYMEGSSIGYLIDIHIMSYVK